MIDQERLAKRVEQLVAGGMRRDIAEIEAALEQEPSGDVVTEDQK